jgi:hypothetical protein
MPSVVEESGPRSANFISPKANRDLDRAEGVELKEELKKMNKQLRQIIELKKHDNLMARFFIFVIFLGFVYLLIIGR